VIDEAEIPTANEVSYLLESKAQAQDSKKESEEEKKEGEKKTADDCSLIFCLDISGSMCN